MKYIYSLLFLALLFSSCYKEDPRANDFVLEYWLEDDHCRPQEVKGYIENLSSYPADKVKIKVDMYECGVRVNHRMIRVKKTLFQNDFADFSKSVGDTITDVKLTIVKVVD